MRIPKTYVDSKGNVLPMGRKNSGNFRRQKQAEKQAIRKEAKQLRDQALAEYYTQPVPKYLRPIPEEEKKKMCIPTSLFNLPGLKGMTARQRKKYVSLLRSGKKELPQ